MDSFPTPAQDAINSYLTNIIGGQVGHIDKEEFERFTRMWLQIRGYDRLQDHEFGPNEFNRSWLQIRGHGFGSNGFDGNYKPKRTIHKAARNAKFSGISYNFSLNPENHQPSGHMNYSWVRNVELILDPEAGYINPYPSIDPTRDLT